MKENKIVITIEDKTDGEGVVSIKVEFNGKEGISTKEKLTPAVVFALAMIDAARAEAQASNGELKMVRRKVRTGA